MRIYISASISEGVGIRRRKVSHFQDEDPNGRLQACVSNCKSMIILDTDGPILMFQCQKDRRPTPRPTLTKYHSSKNSSCHVHDFLGAQSPGLQLFLVVHPATRKISMFETINKGEGIRRLLGELTRPS
jgi:hypothetical protein